MQKLVEGVHTFQEKIFRSQEFFTLAALLEDHVIDPVARWHQYRACQTNNRPSAG
jgi:hypothetical protein